MNSRLLPAQSKLLSPALLSSFLLACATLTSAQEHSNSRSDVGEAEARKIVQQFVGRLKPTLKQAMAEGGPSHAIKVCADEAPAIASELSQQSAWTVKRVSLKQRNQSMATPDQWEREQLEEFDRRQAAGEAPADINTAELVDNRFRYMQAQGVEPLCLACHGKNLAPAVEAALDQFYPNDEASGYSLGEVRGGISLTAEKN